MFVMHVMMCLAGQMPMGLPLLVCLGSQAPARGERREQMALSGGVAELAED